MKRSLYALAGALLLVCGSPATADAKFEHLAVHIEHNATDNDYEIVFEATGGDTGLAMLKVAAPDGRIVAEFKAPNSKLGVRTFRLETPEPKSLAVLQGDYPAGQYKFTASTVAGLGFEGTAMLSHHLPGMAGVVQPRPDQVNVGVKGLRVRWSAPKGLASCSVTIENDETGVKVVQAVVAGSATAFSVPDSVLAPGTRYKVAIGTFNADGNATFVESAFTTVKKK